MKALLRLTLSLFLIVCGIFFLSSFLDKKPHKPRFSFPYKKAGLTERQAAAHLLSRFTFGVKPGEIDATLKVGLENWFLQQLKAEKKNDSLDQVLSKYAALKLSNAEIVETYPRGGQVLKMAIKDGFINKDSVNLSDRKSYRNQIEAYMRQKGLKPQQELYRQFINQKILLAAHSNNQLQEVLADFWFNHFNVSLDKGQCAEFIPAYERDVIRPNVLGKFENLLLSTAKSPAMLRYLDNFSSVGGMEAQRPNQGNQNRGLNENYAREVMELHTLGVDGGYNQQDVTNAARVLTGWTVYPMNDGYSGNAQLKNLKNLGEEKLKQRGFVVDGDFLFNPNRHDKSEKTVLNKHFAANGGYEEGVELLNMLAHHPSTAKFISTKLAVRFVSDTPPASLIEKMAKTFTDKKGDIRQVLITMVSAPEFWNADALREKTKSPFELAISAVRALDAQIQQPYQVYAWISKMGQKVYYYQAPTGFPDRGTYWINTGSLLNRMNFGLALASERIPGIKLNLASLNHNKEPESAEAALKTYSRAIMPERDLTETIKRLTPMLSDPQLSKKVDEAAKKATPNTSNEMMNEDAAIMNDSSNAESSFRTGRKNGRQYTNSTMQTSKGNNAILAQVVGVIIGSPEFQRK